MKVERDKTELFIKVPSNNGVKINNKGDNKLLPCKCNIRVVGRITIILIIIITVLFIR